MSNNSEILIRKYLFGKALLCIVVTRYTIQFIIKSIFPPIKPITDSEREQIRLSVAMIHMQDKRKYELKFNQN